MEEKIYRYLNEYFSYDSFQEGQKEIILDVLEGQNVLGVLRTGSGKSLCFQLPSLILPHLTIVITPLIALMIDQVRETKAFYFKAVTALHSMQSLEERQRIIQNLRQYKLLYLSPELLQQPYILQALKQVKISLFVIDEAHCISQWGYDFRPDYLRLKRTFDVLENPPVLALTGTTTASITDDIVNSLQLPMMKKHLYPMDRENIALAVENKFISEVEKKDRLWEIIDTYNVPTIIYFSSRMLAEEIATQLRSSFSNKKIAYYHGRMENRDRLLVQQQWMNDQLDIICATSAFGMGINKKETRLIIHYHLTTQVESFIQEIGRAGRDGKQSLSILLYKKGDEQLPLQIVENEIPTKTEIKRTLHYLKNYKIIKVDDEQVAFDVNLSVAKWRFLKYQFEKYKILNDNEINYNQNLWENSTQQIIHFCQNRLQLKRQQVFSILNYVRTEKCYREVLYDKFLLPFTRVAVNCCSNCGLNDEQLNFTKERVANNQQYNWRKQLAVMLQVGGNDETS